MKVIRETDILRLLSVLLLPLAVAQGLCGTSFADSRGEEIRSLIESGRYELARQKAVNYLREEPENPEAIYYMATLETDGDLSRNYYQRIVEKYPHHRFADDALYRLGLFYYAVGFYRTAYQKFEKLLKDYPGSDLRGEACYYAGLAKLAVGENSSARGKFEWALKLAGGDLASRAKMGIIDSYFAEGNYTKCIELCEEYIRDDETRNMGAHALLTLARSYEKIGDSSKATEIYSDILRSYPYSYEARELKGFSKLSSHPARISYSIQLGAFMDLKNAVSLKEKMERKGYKVRIQKKLVNDRVFYIVLLGTYKDRVTADSAAESLSVKEGIRGRTVEEEED